MLGRETIVRWVKKKTGPPAITIETEQELETAEKDNEVIVLGYFEKFEVRQGLFPLLCSLQKSLSQWRQSQSTCYVPYP